MIIGYDGSRISVAQRTGTEQYSYLLLEQLIKLPGDDIFRVYTREKIEDPIFEHPRVEQRVIGWKRLWTQGGLALELWKSRPDVLFIPAHTLPALRPFGINSVVTIHDLGYEYLPQYHQFPHKLYLNKSTEYAAWQAGRLIAVSEFTKLDLHKKLGASVDKIRVVYEGVDTQRFARVSEKDEQAARQKYGLAKDYILFVGTVQPRKNLVRLIEAFSCLKDKDIELVIAGGKGWMSDDIYAAPTRYGVEERVKFLGYIDEEDKPGLYAAARVTALVSLFEGFGLPAIESMASGTPVVAANNSSLPEVVGEAGILVEAESVDSIRQGLQTAASDESVRQRLIKNGYEQAGKFRWDRAAEETMAVFKELVGEE